MASICLLLDSKLFRVKPRNCILSIAVSFLSLYIMSKLLKELFFVVKFIKRVFFQFKDIRFALNHSRVCWRILLASFLNFIGSGYEIIGLVTSANRTILLFLFFECGSHLYIYIYIYIYIWGKERGQVLIPEENHGLFDPNLT